MKYFRIHTYDRGPERWESIIGPPFKSKKDAYKWLYSNLEKVEFVSDYIIKEHSR